jgi:diguanylate cyclase (GGDEF)-like protein
LIEVKKNNRSVGRRLTVLIILMIVIISSVMMIIGYARFSQSTEDYYYRMGETTAGIIALSVDADSLDKYLDTLTTDEEYDETMQVLREARAECGAQALYVFRPSDKGVTYVYDTDPSDMWCELGYFDPYEYISEEGTVERLYTEATAEQFMRGGSVDPVMGILTQYGWTITVNEPLYGSDGTLKGYVGIDFDVNDVMNERTTYLWQLALIVLSLTVLFAVLYLLIIRRTIINPINSMAKAADSFLVSNQGSDESIVESDILSLDIKTKDEMESLAEALKSMVRKIDEHLANLKIATIKSETDALTGLLNRAGFEQRVSTLLRLSSEKSQINAFMVIDVDYFKAVNDSSGHSAGDEVLAECAKALRRVMRESDVVGRFGGDEFAVYCTSIGSTEMAKTKAQQIRDEWLKIIPPESEKGVTASIGISFSPKDGQEYQELFDRADEALYQAKEAGRDNFVTTVDNLSE